MMSCKFFVSEIYGRSNRSIDAYSIMQCACTHIRIEAVKNYREKREQGMAQDNPPTAFPQDGTYRWDTPQKKQSKIRYYAGKQDVLWMEEKEKNFLNRVRQEQSEPTVLDFEPIGNATAASTSPQIPPTP